jgi:TPR repeat protein
MDSGVFERTGLPPRQMTGLRGDAGMRLWVQFAALALAFSGASVSTPSRALDVQPAPPAAVAPLPIFKDPRAALRAGVETFQRGDAANSVPALRYAADGGETLAQWKLGRMYAAGEGVAKDDVTAYQYFSRIVREYNEEQANPRNVAAVASAFVAVGVYSLGGIPNSPVRRDVARAQQMFHYAATNFGDANAQYNLGRMYYDGDGIKRNSRQAVAWLSYAAAKNHIEAQAVLGNILFKGDAEVPVQRGRGLMFLTLARESAASDPKFDWIPPLYNKAMENANEFDREAARIELNKYLRRSGRNIQAAQ